MTIQENKSTYVKRSGQSYVYFGGTNYLGLAHRPELMQAAARAFDRYGFSSGAARSTSGETDLLVELEEELARFCRSDSAIVLPAGYISNFAVVDALENTVDAWVTQSFAHGSIRSALSQSRKPILVLPDEMPDSGDVRDHLGIAPDSVAAFFLEPVQPLAGKLTDVDGIVEQAAAQDYIILDEAHSLGVLGESGGGAVQHFDLPPRANLVRTGTFSKALGTFGGFVVTAEQLIHEIRSSSDTYKASTPLSPVACGATIESLRLLQVDWEGTLGRLRSNMQFVNSRLVEMGYEQFAEHVTPIYNLPGFDALAELQQSLLDSRIYVPSVGSYFAGAAALGFRWTIQSGHTEAQMDRLLTLIQGRLHFQLS